MFLIAPVLAVFSVVIVVVAVAVQLVVRPWCARTRTRYREICIGNHETTLSLVLHNC